VLPCEDDWIAELGAHAAALLQCLLHFVFHPHRAPLLAQIGYHAAGYLVQILRMIVLALRTDRIAFALAHELEMIFHRIDRC
jgi:hypothetical protein